MKSFLFESPRLKFREWEISDASWLKELNDDPNVLKYTGDRPFLTILEVENFIDNYDQYQNYGYGRWAVFLKENNVPIGWCGLRYNEEETIDIGFRFFEMSWNKGYATEAAIATLNYAFDELQILEVVGRTSKVNVASKRVLEKAGMKFWKEGQARGLEDVQYYKMINPYL